MGANQKGEDVEEIFIKTPIPKIDKIKF